MPTVEQLVTQLNSLGVHFVTGGDPAPVASLPPADLMAELARQTDTRLRLALIPLLLSHPDYGAAAPACAARLGPASRTTFQLFYTAAVLLQQIYGAQLRVFFGPQSALPDLFSADLNVPAGQDPQHRLYHLALRHRALTDQATNWYGTYIHAVERYFAPRAKEASWLS
jgi:hypothetical protein